MRLKSFFRKNKISIMILMTSILVALASPMTIGAGGSDEHQSQTPTATPYTTSTPEDTILEYQWSETELEQRRRAIGERDTSLLPVCTNEYYAWREETKDRREPLYGHSPASTDFWSAPGCRGIPDREVQGPGGSPSLDHTKTNHWWLGQSTSTSENTYDQGAYAEMEIADVGVDHAANDNFFAARVLILGENNHSLEAGWVEGEFWGDTDQHIYSQDSHTCRRGSCTRADFDSTCDSSRHDAQIAIAAVSANKWRSSCWDGNSWNVMHNNINLGDDDSERMEVFGEIYRTVSGGMSLPSSGINFRAIEVRDGSDWEDWTTSVNTTAWGDDDPYDYEPVRNYTEFNVKNE